MRQALQERSAVPAQIRSKKRTNTIDAPILGWSATDSLSGPVNARYARVLDNWFPERGGIRVRGGAQRHATLGPRQVQSLLTYESSSVGQLFASADGSIFNVTQPASATDIQSPVLTGQDGNAYSYAQFATAGGEFMLAVNGADPLLIFDGAAFYRADQATNELAFDDLTAAFVVGETITGGTSSATAVVTGFYTTNAAGTIGTLRVKDVAGVFVDNETLTGASAGNANSNIPSGIQLATYTLTGVETRNLSHVTSYKNRIFFVEQNTKTAHYLPVDSISGAVSSFSLAGVFKRGGSLLTIGSWSLDAGDGIDDKIVFISDEGEAAIYEGADPSNANDWSLVGLYTIEPPLGPTAMMRAGGDLLVATVEGIVPISQAINKDPAALSLAALTRPIERDWKRTVENSRDKQWRLEKWSKGNMAIVGTPTPFVTYQISANWGDDAWSAFTWGADTTARRTADTPIAYVVNVETGAWCRFTGWNLQSIAVLNERLFFGTIDGKVLEAEVGGLDDGEPYTSQYVGMFDDYGARELKAARNLRPTFVYSNNFNYNVSVGTDYSFSWFPAPSSAQTDGIAVWDSALWDVDVWDAEASERVSTNWHAIAGVGYALAPMIQVTSGSSLKPDALLVSSDVTYELGSMIA